MSRPDDHFAATRSSDTGGVFDEKKTRPMRRGASLSLMDTTLRDGEQTPDVSFTSDEKFRIAESLLLAVRVDRIEICSARVSPGERVTAERIASWARREGLGARIEALGFCDGERSVEWIASTGVSHMNLLVKGSERHCRGQLGKSLAEHVEQAKSTLLAATRHNVSVRGVYLEDWSRGLRENPGYVLGLVEALRASGVQRFYLADTLGVLSPGQVDTCVRKMRRAFPDVRFEFHAHDDYGLATANCLAAALAGIDGLHTTVNGLGERAGNASLEQVCVVVRDHAGRRIEIDETRLVELSDRVALASGRPLGHNAPVVGRDVFTQTAGIHADGDAKGGLYCTELTPARFGRRRRYALGKLAGLASLDHHLVELEITLSPAARVRLLERVVALGDRKEIVRREDLLRLLEAETLDAAAPAIEHPATEGSRKKEAQHTSTPG